VDNEPDILDGMRLLLERWGCTVRTAANNAQAEQQVRKGGPPDLLLVDYHLSEQYNGLDVISHLEQSTGIDLRVIVITADLSAQLEDEVRRRGYGLLRKPIKPGTLRTLMTNMLRAA
jgi:CheY-like chemotaxis protein